MHSRSIKSIAQKISAAFVSFIMVTSLSLPLSVFAEGSPDGSHTDTAPQTTSPETENQTQEDSNIHNAQPTAEDLRNTPSQTPQQTPIPSNSTTSNTTDSHTLSQPQTSTNVDSTAPKTQTTAETNASLNNVINSDATSGNASAHQNTTVGDITTGNAAALATIVNLLQSSVNLNGSQPITFIHDVTGTVSGDLIVDPAVIASIGEHSSLFDNNSANPSVDASTQANINNVIGIHASSGNASANQNTTAGNVQSGDANAVANVVNLINSSIAAGQSFIGMINIYGNLQGNILVPEAFVNSVLGTGTNAPNTDGTIVTTDDNATVTNTVSTTATSGTATATDNTHTGNVGSGQANTNVTILNLTSNQTVGKNALLVFVNVLGNWVGLILDAPSGTTSATLGDSASSSQQANNNPTSINSENNYQITNVIDTSAQSGNATAHENTTVGNVQSGGAASGVNLLNILNSQISLSDWFGILFINVFGTWNGNFGVQTAVVTPPNNGGSGSEGSSSSGGNSSGSGSGAGSPAVFRFVPANQRNYTSRTFSLYNSTTATDFTSTSNEDNQYAPATSNSVGQPTVLGTTNSNNRSDNASLQTSKDKIEEQSLRWWLPLVLILALILAVRYYIVMRHRKNAEEDTPI